MWTSIDDYFSAIASKGDYNFTDPSHHGTPRGGTAGFSDCYPSNSNSNTVDLC